MRENAWTCSQQHLNVHVPYELYAMWIQNANSLASKCHSKEIGVDVTYVRDSFVIVEHLIFICGCTQLMNFFAQCTCDTFDMCATNNIRLLDTW